MECPLKVRHFLGGIFMSRQVKYDVGFKLKAVHRVLSGKSSAGQIAASLEINLKMLRKWVKFYQTYGTSGLRPQHNRYSASFKLQVIETYHKENLSLRATCLRFHIRCVSVLSNWLKKYEQGGVLALQQETRGRPQLMTPKKSSKTVKPATREKELEKELEYLRLENQYLKKLHALMQQEEQAKNKKRK